MNHALSSTQTYEPRGSQARERAVRGVIASYIHELSERHNGGASASKRRRGIGSKHPKETEMRIGIIGELLIEREAKEALA